MLYINKDTELTAGLLQKMINHFVLNVQPQLIKYKEYYDGKHKILSKTYTDQSKPNSKVVTNYCMNITNSYCGYLATPGYISYHSDNDIEAIMDVLRYNDHQTEDSDFLLDALTYGVACELMYIDSDSQTRFKLINPTQCFGVYDDSLSGDLLYFVRMYKASAWDDGEVYYVDVYSDHDIKHYKMNGVGGGLEFIKEEPHYFSQCPANIFYLQDEKSIFDCVMGLQDAVNEILSSEIDDFSAFVDAFLTLSGMDADAEDIAQMKENRVLILPDGGVAQWLTKNSSDTQVENIIKRIHDSIYRIAQCVDFSLENVGGGVSSGIAIRYRLTGMENRSGMIEGRMKKALQRRIEIITGMASLKMGVEVFRDIEIIFKRNLPTDNAEIVNLVNSLKGIISDKTLIGMVPGISDIDAELEEIKKQKEENMAIYNFNADIGIDDKEEDEEEQGERIWLIFVGLKTFMQ